MMNRTFFALSRRAQTLTFMALCLLATQAFADDWPQHLGPAQDATSAETGLLDTWPADGPTELWRHDVGIGFAGAAIVDGQVFLNDREQGVADLLRVFDLDTGKELWQHKVAAPGRVNFPGSRSTPSVTKTHIYTTGGLGHIHAINRKTKKPDWSFNIWDKFPDDAQQFGYGPSAVIVDDLLLLSPTAEGDPIVIAVDPKTGEEVWQSEAKLTTNQTHHTPVIRTIRRGKYIACRDRTHIYFINTENGKTQYQHKVFEIKGGPHVTIPPVTVFGEQNQYIFVTNGYEDGSVMLELVPHEFAYLLQLKERYRIPEGGQVHPALHHDGHLYLNINENANLRGRNLKGGLACIDANTGEIKWKTQNAPNLNRGATLLVDNKLIAFDGDTGELMLINPNPEKFELLAKFTALKSKGKSNNAWSPLVISDGRLIIRDHRQIVCYDLRKQAK